MRSEKEKFLITTAIAYTSKIPHIGNTYDWVLADAIARFKRLEGCDVFFLTGTDEHGLKIQEQAAKDGITPKEHVDRISREMRQIYDLLHISYDRFIRTTDTEHEEIVQKIFKKLYDQGDIYKGRYEGLYCTPCESFFTDLQAPDGLCPDCGRPLQQTSEEAYFFRLSKYADRLMKYIQEHPGYICPEAREKEMINNFLKPGLQDLCVSRTSFDWGIPVTFDEGHVVYVWIDALSNYITALGYNPFGESGALFNKYWPADLQIVGKDIVRFHTIYWPIILMALGLPISKRVFGHPWLLIGTDKMSKSKGNVIYADTLIHHFGVDAVRYYLLKEMPFAQDGNITYERIIETVNADLVNTLGNLVNRTITMVNKYCSSVVPARGIPDGPDDELIQQAQAAPQEVATAMEACHVGDAISVIMELLKRSNKYIDETEPWVLGKQPEQSGRLGTVLYNLLESIRIASVLLTPFIPDAAAAIQAQLNTHETDWASVQQFGALQEGHSVHLAKILFHRLDGPAVLEAIHSQT